MRRLIAIIVAVSFLCATTGLTMHTHYCMGKLIGSSLADNSKDKCANCGMKKGASKKGCCKDEYKILKTVGDKALFKAVVLHSPSHLTAVVPQQFFPVYNTPAFAKADQLLFAGPHGPPLATDLRLYVRNCVFLI